VRLSKVAEGYDPTNRQAVQAELHRMQAKGEVATGLLYLDTKGVEMHQMSGTVDVPLTKVPYEKLCPGSAKLEALQEDYR
jgi:2-oxoglutarate ferredoxin oxidoreductase subunit beta